VVLLLDLGNIGHVIEMAKGALNFKSIFALFSASLFAIIGGFIQLYIIIIGGQSYPLQLFPNAETSSSFYDGVFHQYSATLPEYLLGLGGIGISFCLVLIGIKIFRMLPSSLAD